jgi:hypothetical protein
VAEEAPLGTVGKVTDRDRFALVGSLEGVPSAMAAARDAVDALLRDRGLRRSSPAVTGESLLRGAAASAQLSGSASTLQEARAGTGDALMSACVRTATELLGLVPTWSRAPLQVLARLHAVVGSGLVPPDARGRPSDPNGVARLRELTGVLSTPTSAPGLVVAALVHAEVATAGAFGGVLDPVLGRAAERLVLVATGVDPASVTVPEAGHAELAEEYRAGLQAYASGGTPGVQRWLLHAAQAYARGARAGGEVLASRP